MKQNIEEEKVLGEQNNEPNQHEDTKIKAEKDVEVTANESTNQQDEEQKEDKEEVDLSCGLWKFRTNALGSCFSNLYTFATFVGISALFSQMIHSIINVQLKSIEKQFNIDNSKAGLFDVASKAGYLSTSLFAGHFAKKAHIPVIIGLSGLFQGFLLTVPAILQLTDPYELPILTSASNSSNFGDSAKYMCDYGGANVTSKAKNLEPSNDAAFAIILVVQTIKGVTDTFHSSFLPVLYMDDNIVDKGKMAIFLGIQNVIQDLASPIGKQINGILTEIPIDLKKTDMDPKDGRFVAAWWLAFLIFGAGLGILSFPLMLFPRKLISKSKQKAALDKALVSYAGGQVQDEIVKPELTHTASEEKDRKQNMTEPNMVDQPVRKYSTIGVSSRKGSLASVAQSNSRRPSMFPPVVPPTKRKVSLAGDLVFEQPIKVKTTAKSKKEELKDMLIDFPKAVLRIVKNPAYDLLLLDTAVFAISYSGTSLFRSVYMSNEYNVPMSEVTLASGISTALGHLVGTAASSFLTSRVNTRMGYLYIIMSSYIFTCFITPLYLVFGCGNEMVYGATGQYGIPVNTSSVCDCSNSKVLISCGDDGQNYLNPCYAGCKDVDGKIFTDCQLLTNSSHGTNVYPGLCPSDCHTNFIVYTLLSGLQNVATSMSMIPRRLLVLRLVDPKDRGFATSLSMFFFTFIGLPAPNLFGKVMDNTCLVWDGKFCALYDRDKIRYFLSGLDVGVHGLVQLTFFVMLIIFKLEERKLKKKQAQGIKSNDTELTIIVPE